MKVTNVDLLNGKILKSLIIFSIPIFVSNLFQQLYNTIDIMIVGNNLDESALAAMGASAAIFEMLMGFVLGSGNGFSMVVARIYGSGDRKQLRKSVAGALVIGMAIILVIMALSYFGLYPLLELLNTPANIIDDAYSYIFIIAIFVSVMFLYNLFAGFLRAVGNSFMPLIFLIVSSVLNIVLDILFIIKLGMGIQGAAIATVISQGISSVLCVIYIVCKCKILIPKKEDFRFDKELYKELFAQGMSMGIMLLVVSAGTVILQSAINGFGDSIIAGHTTARKINSFAYMPELALALSLATFVSQNKGANKIDRIKTAVKYSNIFSIIWGIFATIILAVFSPFLVKLLSNSDNQELISYANKYLVINAAFYPVLGVLFNMRNSLQAMGQKILPLISSGIELAGKIIFVILLIPILDSMGIIICEPVIWCFMCLQLVFSFYTNQEIKKSKKKLKKVL